jgi:zinc protease
MQIYVLGGLLAEDDASNGTGGAMMALMTRGTATRSADAVTDFFDLTGGSIDGTSGNNTFGLSATCLKENFAKTFDVFADVATAPKFSPEELEKLRPQLAAAVERQTEDWFDEGYKYLREEFFTKGPYRNLAAGKADVIAKLTADQIRTHYEKFFCNPKNTVLAIYGDVDSFPDLEKSPFAAIKTGAGALNLTTVDAPAKTFTRPTDKASATVVIGYGPGTVVGDKDRHAMVVLQTLLGGYNSPGGSLLHETLRGKGLVYTVQAGNIAGVARDGKEARGLFLISALGEPQNSDEIVTIIGRIVADVKAGKVTDKDVASARDQAITGHQLQNQTIASQASAQALDELMGLGYADHEKFTAAVKAVTKDDVVRVANACLKDPVIVITQPKK